MGHRDPRVDDYIRQALPFAQPILTELRERMHAACPDLQETIKWRMPTFEHGGILAGMAAFKKHCSFGFWQDKQLRELPGLAAVLEAAGRTTTVDDLPSRRAFAQAVKQAVAMNAEGAAAPKRQAAPKPRKAPIAVHPEFARALDVAERARANFDAFPPGAQREYIEWIAEAKQETTRARRIEQAVEWLNDGKRRHWKYERCRAAAPGQRRR
jgi:uncharacterized protein YdeI (YjbR/CyaY-like superfamily)